MHSCDESLFLALNFDGGPCLDRIMTLISGMAIWIPFYLLILWLVCRRYGWRNTLLFLAALALALVLSDMLCGIFKHSGPLKHLLGRFSSPLAPDVLSGPRRTRHSGRLALRLAACRAPHTEQPRTRSRRSRRREIRHRILPRRDDRGSRRNVGRRHPPPLVHMAQGSPQRC